MRQKQMNEACEIDEFIEAEPDESARCWQCGAEIPDARTPIAMIRSWHLTEDYRYQCGSCIRLRDTEQRADDHFVADRDAHGQRLAYTFLRRIIGNRGLSNEDRKTIVEQYWRRRSDKSR